jgi:hypothetical protein
MLLEKKSIAGAVELLSHRLKKDIDDKKFTIYGVEDSELHEEQKNIVKEMAEKIKSKKESYLEGLRFDRLYERYNQLTHQRSVYATRVMKDQMDSRGIETAALIYGLGHFEVISSLIKAEDIGCISFFPGYVEATSEDGLNYALNL